MISLSASDFVYDRAGNVLSAEASTLQLQQTPQTLVMRGRTRNVEYRYDSTIRDASQEDVFAWDYVPVNPAHARTTTRVRIVND